MEFKSTKILFDGFCLEVMDELNKEHKNILNIFKDEAAVELCRDPSVIFPDESIYLAKNDDGYFGYLSITDSICGERQLCYIIQENVRKKGLGTILLNNTSSYLLNEDVETSSVLLYIMEENVAGIKLATKCGFLEKTPSHKQKDSNYRVFQKNINMI